MGTAKDELRTRIHMAVERVLSAVDDETIETINAELSGSEFMASLDKSLFEPTPIGQQIIENAALYREVHEKSPSKEGGFDFKAAGNIRNRSGYQLTQDTESELGRLMNATLLR